MGYVKTKQEDHILHILLDKGRSNAIDQEMVRELLAVLKASKDDLSIEGVVFSGKEHFFSSGLDLITLYTYDKLQMELFWTDFMMLLKELVSYPKPIVAAITGHSPAGGCVLSLCCDYRIMVSGDYIIGLNEVPVGLIVPHSIFGLYRFWLGEGLAYRSLLSGKLFTPEEAKEIGLVDDLVPFDRIQNAAVNRLKAFTQFEKGEWQATKLNLRKDLIALFAQDQKEVVQQVLDQWWKPSTRSIMKTIIDNLMHKKT